MWANHFAPPAATPSPAPAAPTGPFPAIALTGMILGLVLWVLVLIIPGWSTSPFALSFALAAAVCGGIGFQNHRKTGRGYGFGLAGILLGSIALVFMVAAIILTMVFG